MAAGDEVRAFFERLPERLAERRLDGASGSFAFAVAGAGEWVAEIGEQGATVRPGAAEDADVRVACSAEDWLALVAGDLDPQLAYRTGRLSVDGDMSLAMRVRSLFL